MTELLALIGSNAINTLLSVKYVVLVLLSAVVGLIVGSIPGVGPIVGIIILFPVILSLDPALGLASMAVVYGTGTYGGSLSAILFNVPGTPGSTATLLDGYPMTTSNKAKMAIGISTISSFLGALLGLLFLVLFAPLLANLALVLGPPEYFLLTILGLVIVIGVVPASRSKAIISVCIGVLLASIGLDPINSRPRYTLGISYLQSGLHVIVVVIGAFAITQVLKLVEDPPDHLVEDHVNGSTVESREEGNQDTVWDGVFWTLTKPMQLLRSGLIGVSLGSLPGLGIVSANFFSYFVAKVTSDDPDSFGTGNPEGVLSAETANNSSAYATLIPTLALGIPGGVVAAIFLGVMISQGITPGRGAFSGTLPTILYASIILGNLCFLVAGLVAANHIAKLATLPRALILAGIIVFSLVGAYSIRLSYLDLVSILFIGIFSYELDKYSYSLVALIIAFVLTPISERALAQSLLLSGWDSMIFVQSTTSKLLILMNVLVLAVLVYRSLSEADGSIPSPW